MIRNNWTISQAFKTMDKCFIKCLIVLNGLGKKSLTDELHLKFEVTVLWAFKTFNTI